MRNLDENSQTMSLGGMGAGAIPNAATGSGSVPISGAPGAGSRRWLWAEILVVVLITFGASGLRSIVRLVERAQAGSLKGQSVALNAPQSQLGWADWALQGIGIAVLLGWGALAWVLLRTAPRMRRRDGWWGVLLAAAIGLPGVAWYLCAVATGLSVSVVPSSAHPIIAIGWAVANGVAEESVVVAWLATRLRQLGWRAPAIVAASALLRGSYHLYQGYSAGLGNVVMGVIFTGYFLKTGRVWPLIIAHILIDVVAFIGYPLAHSWGWV